MKAFYAKIAACGKYPTKGAKEAAAAMAKLES
jgi:hypothetical protein